MAPIQQKIKILNRIYAVYDQFTATLNMVCEKYCSDCCTCNVTLTTLEAYSLVAHLTGKGDTTLFHKLESLSGQKRFRPTITTNRLAQLCLRGEPVPEEESDPSWGKCPFLHQAACSIYSLRPFGCRCLLSSQKCSAIGCAEIPSFVLTVNTVFMQVIEHADRNGLTGNLIDLIPWMAEKANRQKYESAMLSGDEGGLIANRPMPCLMVPDAHREALKDIIATLQRIG
ncbi:MAG: YkgJ family cysteine cluster protein [Desulfobacterales bacterium]|jgi:Fe-S-cluster containining protein|nr:YkgJ family cysteine cluster protein [Desulfobacterales bacterium]